MFLLALTIQIILFPSYLDYIYFLIIWFFTKIYKSKIKTWILNTPFKLPSLQYLYELFMYRVWNRKQYLRFWARRAEAKEQKLIRQKNLKVDFLLLLIGANVLGKTDLINYKLWWILIYCIQLWKILISQDHW